jgi:hypothetical protein
MSKDIVTRFILHAILEVKQKINFSVIMPRGGKRTGTGRPKSGGENSEPTKTVRVPLSFAEKIPELLKEHQAQHSTGGHQLPAKATETYLPLESLAWDAFESFCYDFIARTLAPQETYRYGTQGNAQQGIDIVADLKDGEKWAFQCKQWQKFTRKDAINVVEKAEGFKADRYILLLSRVAVVDVRKVIADAPKWELWDVQDISQRVRILFSDRPEAARRLVRDHFHPEWQNAFLGISKLTPFVSSEDFFHNWLNTNQLFNHTWKLEGRDDALKLLHEFVTSNDRPVAILSGRGGIGKTKILYEFAKTFEHPHFHLWFVEDEMPISPENADSLPLQPCIIVVDDAHRRDERDIVTLHTIIRNRIRDRQPEIKLILAARPHGVQNLQSQLNRKGTDYANLGELKELSRQDMKALAGQAVGLNYTHFADQLAAIAHDSPLVAVVGGRLLAEQSISPSLLERNSDFRRLVLSRFEDVLIGKVSQLISPELCRKVLKLIAAAAPIQLLDKRFQAAAIEVLNIDEIALQESIGTLEKAGVLVRRGNHLRITPDVLADHILYTACLTEHGEPTGYAQKTFEAFREIYSTQVIGNLAELDWRIRSSSEQEINLIDPILQDLREEFKQSCNLDRCKLLDLIEEIAYYQPEYSLEIVQYAMRHPATTPEDDSISERYHFTHSNVLAKLPEILKRISYTLEYVPICCDLLWQIGRDDPHRSRNNPPKAIGVLIDLAKYAPDKSLKFNEEVLKSIGRYLQEPNAHTYIYSLFDILEIFFEKEVEHHDYDGTTLKIRTYALNQSNVKEIRNKALQIISDTLNSNDIKVVLRVLNLFEKSLEELHDKSEKPIDAVNKTWEFERLIILKIIDSLIIRNDIDPLIHLKIIENINWHARFSSSSIIQQKVQSIILAVPRTDCLKLTGALIGNYQWNSLTDAFQYDQDWIKYEQNINQINNDLLEQFLIKYPTPQQGIQILNERLKLISENGENISTKFLCSFSRFNPSYSIDLCERVLEMGDCSLSHHIALMLEQAKDFDISRAVKLAQVAVDSGISSFCQSFANRYWTWGDNISRELIHKLIIHPDVNVKRSAVASLAKLVQSQPQLAVSLALDVDVDGDIDIAKGLFTTFTMHSLDVLTEKELKILLYKLKDISRLDAYSISEFLVYTSQKVPNSAIQLMLNRISVSVEKTELNYRALPSKNHENCLHYLSRTEEYENILRRIRDIWFKCNSKRELISAKIENNSASNRILSSIRLEPLYRELYKEVSFTLYEESTLNTSFNSIKLLSEWIDSEDAGKIRAASILIKGFPAGFVFSHLDFVSNLLEQAYKTGDECYETVCRNLFHIAMAGVKVGVPGQPFPEDVQLRDRASAISKQFFKGSPTHKFFESLVKVAEHDITSQKRFGKEQWE